MKREQLNNGPYSIRYVVRLEKEEMDLYNRKEITDWDIITACDNRTEPTCPGEIGHFGGTCQIGEDGVGDVRVYID